MADKVFKKIRVVGCSEKGLEQAISTAVEKAAHTIHRLSWFEVVELRGAISNDKISEWQATVEMAFKVEED